MNSIICFMSAILLSCASLAISISVFLGMSDQFFMRIVLTAFAVGIEGAKIASISYSYTMIVDRDLRSIMAVSLALFAISISVTTVASFFDIQTSKQNEINSSILSERQNRKLMIESIDSQIMAKETQIVDMSNTISNLQRINHVSESKKILRKKDAVNDQLSELNKEKIRLLKTPVLEQPEHEKQTGLRKGYRRQSQAGPNRSRSQSIRVPSIIAGNNYMFFGLGFFIDFALACMVILGKKKPSKQTAKTEKTDQIIDCSEPVQKEPKNPVQTTPKNTTNKKTKIKPVSTKNLKADGIARFVIEINTGDTISISQLRKKFSCGHGTIVKVLEPLIKQGLVYKNEKGSYVRKNKITEVKNIFNK